MINVTHFSTVNPIKSASMTRSGTTFCKAERLSKGEDYFNLWFTKDRSFTKPMLRELAEFITKLADNL